jgi:hypothetical protein
MSVNNSPFGRSAITHRSPPPMSPQNPIRDQEDENVEAVTTADIQGWLSSIDKCLNEICMVVSDGKMNTDQKLRPTSAEVLDTALDKWLLNISH